jgi:3-oxoadipate enol-lactonase
MKHLSIVLLIFASPVIARTQGHYLKIGETRIYYEDAGAGEALLLIHDGLASSVTWDEEWAALSKRFHVIRYDRRG